MRYFELAEPSTLEEACGLLNDNGEAKVIAGGTALLTLIKHGIFIPKTLINLKKIKPPATLPTMAKRGCASAPWPPSTTSNRRRWCGNTIRCSPKRAMW
jgi:hypothetical protein